MKYNSYKTNLLKSNNTIFNFDVLDLNNKKVSLEDFRMYDPIIVVNVASK